MREITASVTERGQVTIPAEVRKVLGIKARDKVSFVIDDGIVVLKKPRFTLETAAQSVPPLNKPLTWQEMRTIAQEEVAARYAEKMRRGDA
jgi:AbrB family looped-hinge helix DNA binding protein